MGMYYDRRRLIGAPVGVQMPSVGVQTPSVDMDVITSRIEQLELTMRKRESVNASRPSRSPMRPVAHGPARQPLSAPVRPRIRTPSHGSSRYGLQESLTNPHYSTYLSPPPPPVRYLTVYACYGHDDAPEILGQICISNDISIRQLEEMVMTEMNIAQGFDMYKNDIPIHRGQYHRKVLDFFNENDYLCVIMYS